MQTFEGCLCVVRAYCGDGSSVVRRVQGDGVFKRSGDERTDLGYLHVRACGTSLYTMMLICTPRSAALLSMRSRRYSSWRAGGLRK